MLNVVAVVPTCRGFRIPVQTIPVDWIIVHDRQRWPVEGEATHLVAPLPERYGAGSDSIRSAGFLEALRRKADITLTVDDDCWIPPDWAARHRDALLGLVPEWSWTYPIRTRGTPEDQLPVAVSHGLWDGVPDLDAGMQQALGPVWGRAAHEPTPIRPPFAQSSMNLAFWTRWTPVLYQPAQGPDFGIDRFADIWGGLLAQRVLTLHRQGFVNGAAPVYHQRASDVATNARKEAPGLELHDRFWRHVWAFQHVRSDPVFTYRALAEWLQWLTPQHPYFGQLRQNMEWWIRACRECQ